MTCWIHSTGHFHFFAMKFLEATKTAFQNPKLDENIDFYLEAGKMVFTETYLKKRGYCCKNGCRHCPYSFKKKTDEADED